MYIYTVKEVQFGMLFLIDQQNEEQCSSLNFSLSFFFFLQFPPILVISIEVAYKRFYVQKI